MSERDDLFGFAMKEVPLNMKKNQEQIEQMMQSMDSLWSYKFTYNKWKKGRLQGFIDAFENKGKEEIEKETELSLGYGKFMIIFQDQVIHVLHKQLGDPVGCKYGAAVHRYLVFFVEGKNNTELLSDFMEYLVEVHGKDEIDEGVVSIRRFMVRCEMWDTFYKVHGRSLESVILPKKTKQRLVDDIEDFMDNSTRKWYLDMGIPYKRSYLFYGVPGSGKTSIIAAMAAKYNRPVCYISPSEPKMTDDVLKKAVASAPSKSIIVLEDVDALFDKERKSDMENHLTFSGLLNALDGVGSGLGQIFILTTNHREKLDPALIRNGRVDLQLEFDYIRAAQVEEMFGIFYPDAEAAQREEFREKVFETAKRGKDSKISYFSQLKFAFYLVSMRPCIPAAMLQKYFVTHRRCTLTEAIENVTDLVEDLQQSLSLAGNIN